MASAKPPPLSSGPHHQIHPLHEEEWRDERHAPRPVFHPLGALRISCRLPPAWVPACGSVVLPLLPSTIRFHLVATRVIIISANDGLWSSIRLAVVLAIVRVTFLCGAVCFLLVLLMDAGAEKMKLEFDGT